MSTLFLKEARAARVYQCSGCGETILRGTLHFRHDPDPITRLRQGEEYTHWCRKCVLATNKSPKEPITRRLFVKKTNFQPVRGSDIIQLSLFEKVRIEIVGIGLSLSEYISCNPTLIHTLSPEEFEEFICEQLYRMGFEPKQIGKTFQSDGGIDVVFWPRKPSSFPFLGAAQIKHHRNTQIKEGPGTVREFMGSISGRYFAAGMIVTNTSFTPNAEWFALRQGGLIRLRGFGDICRWLENNFSSEAEWREIPSTIEFAPGVSVKIR